MTSWRLFILYYVFQDVTTPVVGFTSLQQGSRGALKYQTTTSIFGEPTDPIPREPRISCRTSEDELIDQNSDKSRLISRRKWLIRSTLSSVISPVAIHAFTPSTALADDVGYGNVYVPAVRPTLYQVDSTIPPTLLPVPSKQKQFRILQDLGRGLGTDKKEVFVDRINLNNMLQKAVYGTINAVQSAFQPEQDKLKSPASFVCFGLPMQPSDEDVKFTVSLLQTMLEKRLRQKPGPPTAIGIAVLPCTLQITLDDLIAGRILLSDLPSAAAKVEGEALRLLVERLLPLYQPLFEYAVQMKVPLMALGLSLEDRSTVRSRGIQGVNPTSRSRYVLDPEGFIATTNDPFFKLYTDRSLLKDRLLLQSDTEEVSEGNYFAERILSHEAAATFVSQYALDQGSECLLAIVAPINDVRYMGGINARIPRIYQSLTNSRTTTSELATSSISSSPVTMNDVTTVLVNPTALETLSRTVRLRLEIGTGPDTLAYQTKIADYLWFSSSPPVKLLPRVMDY